MDTIEALNKALEAKAYELDMVKADQVSQTDVMEKLQQEMSNVTNVSDKYKQKCAELEQECFLKDDAIESLNEVIEKLREELQKSIIKNTQS